MQMTGHLTRSMLAQYHIVADADLKEAAARLDAVTGGAAPASKGRLKRFARR